MCGSSESLTKSNKFLFNNKSQIGSSINFIGEFDPGSGRTLAACLTHASRTEKVSTEIGADASGKSCGADFARPISMANW